MSPTAATTKAQVTQGIHAGLAPSTLPVVTRRVTHTVAAAIFSTANLGNDNEEPAASRGPKVLAPPTKCVVTVPTLASPENNRRARASTPLIKRAKRFEPAISARHDPRLMDRKAS